MNLFELNDKNDFNIIDSNTFDFPAQTHMEKMRIFLINFLTFLALKIALLLMFLDNKSLLIYLININLLSKLN